MIRSSLLLALLSATAAVAQPRPDTSGEITFQTEGKQQSPYTEAQDGALDAFKKLAAQAPAGSIAPVTLSKSSLTYLAAVYLMCVVKQGSCPAVLDGILEADIVNAKLAGNTKCPFTVGFWGVWKANDMERRQEFSIGTGVLGEFSNFKTNHLPRYLNCGETISQILKGSGTPEQFFRARYGKNQVFSNLVLVIETVKAKIPNIFAKVGVKQQ
jgi:hypothetical protein